MDWEKNGKCTKEAKHELWWNMNERTSHLNFILKERFGDDFNTLFTILFFFCRFVNIHAQPLSHAYFFLRLPAIFPAKNQTISKNLTQPRHWNWVNTLWHWKNALNKQILMALVLVVRSSNGKCNFMYFYVIKTHLIEFSLSVLSSSSILLNSCRRHT